MTTRPSSVFHNLSGLTVLPTVAAKFRHRTIVESRRVSQPHLYIGLALLLSLGLLLSLVVLLIESQVEDPITGMPADLRGKISFSNGKLQLLGGKMSASDWKEAMQYIFTPRGGYDPVARWTVNRTDIHATASYTFWDGRVTDPGPAWIAPPRGDDGFAMLANRIVDAVVSGLRSAVIDLLDFFTGRAQATVVFDASSELERTGTTDPATWTHTPVGTPRGVAVLIADETTSTDHVLAVKYNVGASGAACASGGVSLKRIIRATDTAGEPGSAEIWFLGTGLPTGAVSVCVDLDSATTDDYEFVAVTWTAAGDIRIVDADTVNEDATNPSVTEQYGGYSSVSAMMLYSGLGTLPSSNCSGNGTCTNMQLFDDGGKGSMADRGPAAGTTNQVMGYTAALDDVALAVFTITDASCGASSSRFWVGGTGTWNTTTDPLTGWSESTGGFPGCAIPTTSNAVTFDSLSCTASCTITVDTAANTNALTVDNSSATIQLSSTNNLTASTGTNTASCGAVTYTVCINAGTVNWAASASGTFSTSSTSANAIHLNGGSIDATNGGTIQVTGAGGGFVVNSASSFIKWGSSTAHSFTGCYSNSSTSASWNQGTGTVTIKSNANCASTKFGGTANFTEFHNLTLDSTAAASTTVTYTMVTNAIKWDGTLLINNTVASATGNVILDDSVNNLSTVTGTAAVGTSNIKLGTLGVLKGGTATVSLSGDFEVAAANAYVTSGAGTWTVGKWNQSTPSTSGSWNFQAGITFNSSGSATMAFGDSSSYTSSQEFRGGVTFDPNTNAAVVYTVGSSTGTLAIGGLVTIRNSNTGTSAKITLDDSVNNKNLTFAAGLTIDNPGAAEIGAVLKTGTATVSETGNVSIGATDPDSGITSSAGGAWTVNNGTWTNASTSTSNWSFAAPITFKNGVARTMTFCGTVCGPPEFTGAVTFDSNVVGGMTYTMATRPLNMGGDLTILNSTASASGNTVLDTSGSNLAITATAGIILGTRGTLTANASTIKFKTFDSSGTSAVFNKGTSLLEAATTGGTFNTVGGNANNFTADPGVTITSNGSASVDGTTTVTGVWATSTFTTTITTLAALSGGITAGASGTKTISSSVTVNFTGYFVFGGATWTFSNASWTNNSTSASWDATASGTVMFTATGSNNFNQGNSTNYVGGVAFPSLTFDPNSATGATWTLVTNALKISGALTIQDSNASGTTILTDATNNLTFTTGGVTVGSHGTLTLGSGTSTVSGNWDSSNSTAAFNKGTSTIVMSGTSKTVAIRNASNGFASLTISGTITQNSAIDVSSAISITGTLTTSGNNVTGGATLTVSGGGTLAGSSAAITVSDVTMTGASANTISLTTGSITASGNWDTSGSSSTWDRGTSGSVTLSGASKTVKMLVSGTNNEFYALTVSGTVSTLSDITMKSTGTGVNLTGSLTIANSFTTNDTSVTGGGNLTIATAGTLTATASTVSIGNLTMTSATSGTITLTSGSWTVSGSWDTSGAGSTFAKGTSTVTLSGATKTVKILNASNGFASLTVSGTITAASAIDVSTATSISGTFDTSAANNYALSGGGSLTISTGGTLTANSSTVTVGNVTMTSATSGTITISGTASWSVSGNWDTSGSGTTFTKGTSTITMSGSGTTIAIRNSANNFNNLTISAAGTVTTNTLLDVGGSLTVNGGAILATGTQMLTVATLAALSGGITAGASGTKTIANDVTINATGYFSFGGTAGWEFKGAWTNNSTSASWSTGTGTVLFSSASNVIMTFGGSNLGVNEFNNVTFTSSSAAAQTFTMASRSLVWGGTSTVSDLSGTSALATANLGLTGGAVSVGNGGILTANASAAAVSNVTMTGGTSGTITLTSGSWAVSGDWDTSGASSTFTKGTSTVTLSGASKTLTMLNSSNGFYDLAISGTITQLSAFDVSNALSTSGSGALTTSGFGLTGGANVSLSGTGGITGTTSSMTVNDVTIGSGTSWSMTSGSISASGSWDSSAGTFAKGTSIVTLSGTSKTLAINGTAAFYDLTITGSYTLNTALNVAHLVTLSNALSMNGKDMYVGGTTSIGANGDVGVNTGGTLTMSGSVSLTVSGNWDSSTGTFNKGTSTVNLSGTAKTVAITGTAGFYNLTITGTITQATAIDVSNGLQTSGSGTLTTSGYSITGGAATTLSGTGGIAGSTSSITIGALTVGSGTTFSVSSGSINTSNGNVSVTGAITVSGAGSLTFGAGNLTVNNGGIVTANAATATVANVTMTGGTSGTITLTSGSWTVSGNWDTSGAGSTLAMGASAVTMTGSAKTLKLNGAQGFYNLSVSGTYTLNSALNVSNTLTLGNTLTMTGEDVYVGTTTSTGTNGDLVVSAGGTLTMSGAVSLTVPGIWDSSGGTFNRSTSAVTLSGTGETVKTADSAHGFYQLTISGTVSQLSAIDVITVLAITGTLTTSGNNITGGANLTVSSGGVLTGTTSSITVGNVTMNDASADAISLTSGNISASGNWDTSGSSSSFTRGTSTVTLAGTAKTLRIRNASNGFYNLIVSGTITQSSAVDVSNALSITGALTTSGNDITGGANLTVSGGGTLTASTSAITATDVAMNDAGTNSISFTSGTISASGNWDTSGSSSTWTEGTGRVTLSGTSKTIQMRIGGTNHHLYDVTISGTISTLSDLVLDNSMSLTGTFTIANTFDTSSKTVSGGGDLTIATGGTFTANASSVTVGSVTMTSTTSGTITLTSGSWTVSGNWDTSGTGTTFTKGTSTITLSGASRTVAIHDASNGFYSLTITGSVTMSTAIDVSNSTTISGTLATASQALSGNGTLAISTGGALTANASTVSVSNVTMTSATSGTITLTSGSWTASGNWDTSGSGTTFTKGTSTITMTGASKTIATRNVSNGFYNLTVSGTVTQTTGIDASNAVSVSGMLSTGGLAVSGGASLTVQTGGTVTANASAVTVGDVTMTSATSGTITLTAGSWTVSGDWNTSGAGTTFTKGTSTVTLTGTAKTVAIRNSSNGFYNLTISGTLTMSTAIDVSHTVATSGLGTLTTAGLDVNGGADLTLAGSGGLAGSSSTLTLANVTIGSGTTLSMTSGTIDVSGDWNSSAGTLTFGTSTISVQAAGKTYTFGSGQFYNYSTNNNPVTIENVSMAANGTLALGSSSVTVTGNWDTSASGTTLGAGTSTATMNGSGKTLAIRNSSNGFYALVVSGTITMGTAIDVSNSTTISGTLATASQALSGNGTLAISTGGTLTANASTVSVSNVTMTSATSGTITLTSGSWTVSGNWDTSGTGTTFTKGISTVTLSGTSKTVAIRNSSNGFYDLTISGTITMSTAIDVSDSTTISGTLSTASLALSGSGALTVSTGGALTANASTVTVSDVTMTSATSGTINLTSGSWTVSGNWDTSGSGTTFTSGTSTVTLSGASRTVKLLASQSFAILTVTGTISQASQLTTSALNLNAGSLTKGTNALTVNGNLTFAGGALLSTSGTVTISGNVDVSAAASYIAFGSESWTVSGTWTNASTSGSWSAGSGTVTFNDSTSATMTFAGSNLSVAEFNNVVLQSAAGSGTITFTMSTNALRWAGTLTVPGSGSTTVLATANLGLTGGALTIGNLGVLTANASAVSVSNVTMTGGSSGTITLTSGSWTVSGNWDTSGAGSAFAKGMSTITLSGATKTVKILNSGNGFYNLTVSGTLTQSSAIDVSATFSISGSLGTGPNPYHDITGTSSLTVTGTGTLTANSSMITLKSLDTSAGGATFTAGTSTIVIGTSGGSVNIPQTAYNVTVNSGISTTFTSSLTWSSTLTLTSSTVTFNGNLTSAGAATITFASATVLIGGSWNTSSAGSWTSTTSTVTFTGSGKTLTVASGQTFATLTFSGTTTLGSDVTGTSLTVSSAATLTKTGFSVTFNALTVNATGTLADGSVNVQNFTVTDDDATALITIGAFTAWTFDGTFAWSHTDTKTTDTITLTIGGNTASNHWSVLKNGSQFAVGTVDGSGQVVFTTLGGNDGFVVTVSAPCGANEFWILGTGNWSDVNHWASSSGGAFGCPVPTSSIAVHFDNNSGSGTATVNVNAAMASLITTGSTIGTISIGTFDFAVSGSVTHSGGSITIGATAASGFTVGGALTLSGSANISMSGASKGSVAGNVNVSASAAYIAFGSGPWTFSGSWTNASTSASWSAGTAPVTFNSASSQTMTFAGSNLSGNEFSAVVFDSGSNAVVFTMSSRGLNAGAITVQGGSAVTTLATSNLALATSTLTVAANGALAAGSSAVAVTGDINLAAATAYITSSSGGSWTVSGSWTDLSSSASWSFSAPITFRSAASQTMTWGVMSAIEFGSAVTFDSSVAGGVTFTSDGNALRIGGTLTVQNSTGGATGATDLSTGANPYYNVTAGAVTLGTYGRLEANSVTISVNGNWTVTASNATFVAGTSTVSFGAAATIAMTQSFYNLTVTAGTATEASNITVSASLTVSGGTFAKSTFALSTSSVTLSGGAVTSTSGNATVTGNVSVSSASSYFAFGSETWTVSGSWANASTSASWGAGSGTVVFNASSSQTMTFAGSNLSVNEFNNVTFNGGSNTVTFTTATNGLKWAGTLTVQGGSGTTTLATSNLSLTGGALTIGNAGVLMANASAVSVSNVGMTGGTSGTITLTNGSWTVSGDWDTSGAGSTFTPATGTVTMTGSGKTVKIATGQQFCGFNLSGGTVTMASFLLACAVTISAGTLDLDGFPVFVNGNLTISGTGSVNFDAGNVTVLGNIVDTSSNTNSGAGTLILPSAATQSVQGGVWPNVQVVGGEKDFTASLTTLNVTLVGTANVTIRVTAGITWTLTPGGVLSGVSSTARLVLTSSGTWTVDVSGVTGIAQWVAVDHSSATGPGMQAFNATDNGNNANWAFPSGGTPLGPFLLLLQQDPVFQASLSALGFVGALLIRRIHRKRVTCPVCGHRFTEECREHG